MVTMSMEQQHKEPPMEKDYFTPSEEWVNWGDVNPKDHGGSFVRWDSDYEKWRVVVTLSDEGGQTVWTYDVYPDDIWKNPKTPNTELTDYATKIAEGYQWFSGSAYDYEMLQDPEAICARLFHYIDMNATTSRHFDPPDYDELIASHGVEDY